MSSLTRWVIIALRRHASDFSRINEPAVEIKSSGAINQEMDESTDVYVQAIWSAFLLEENTVCLKNPINAMSCNLTEYKGLGNAFS